MVSQKRHHHTLRTNVPRAGFTWPPRASVLVQKRHDRAILNALRDQGDVTSLLAGVRGRARDQVERVLADMFKMATADAVAGRINQFDTPLDWVTALRPRLQWAGLLEEDIFLELFLRLSKSRRKWFKHPREPLRTEEHGILAHAIDEFHQAASVSWGKPYNRLFLSTLSRKGTGGACVSDGAMAEKAPHTRGRGAHTAAGESYLQMPSVLDGAEDEDGDIRMDNGEEQGGVTKDNEEGDRGVREVFQRLAGTYLGEEMEMEMDE